jgi:hypothetical protein
MKKANTVYGLVLTYAAREDFDPAEYQRTGDEAVLELYKIITRKHLGALMQSIRRHKSTQKGIGWSARIYAISSCEKGKCVKGLLEDKNIPEALKSFFRKKRRERLHIHLLIVGEPGSTIAEYITRYWEMRHGLVSKKKFGFDDVNWLEEYFDSQMLTKRRLAV